ncbi:hypothetical protein SAMN04487846_3429 [Microbacterium sp. cf046]|uniref:hypothetical protein n=1 Tax=Microbacterium sp. cf046 TaxID=1761803 RepID=UPI0008E9C429|nr:hypothetical protein [Microbacterium sp. cf046]SFS17027.1 hypothetical protein SAMN04487846_3429 [Microbacterium sp. cf046]
MTVIDGDLTFKWCGKPTARMRALSIEYRTTELDGELQIAAGGEGSYRVAPGTQFSVTKPPPGVTYSESKAVPITEDFTQVHVYGGQSLDDLKFIFGVFDTDGLSEYTDGLWIYPNGQVTTTPCES